MDTAGYMEQGLGQIESDSFGTGFDFVVVSEDYSNVDSDNFDVDYCF